MRDAIIFQVQKLSFFQKFIFQKIHTEISITFL